MLGYFSYFRVFSHMKRIGNQHEPIHIFNQMGASCSLVYFSVIQKSPPFNLTKPSQQVKYILRMQSNDKDETHVDFSWWIFEICELSADTYMRGAKREFNSVRLWQHTLRVLHKSAFHLKANALAIACEKTIYISKKRWHCCRWRFRANSFRRSKILSCYCSESFIIRRIWGLRNGEIRKP